MGGTECAEERREVKWRQGDIRLGLDSQPLIWLGQNDFSFGFDLYEMTCYQRKSNFKWQIFSDFFTTDNVNSLIINVQWDEHVIDIMSTSNCKGDSSVHCQKSSTEYDLRLDKMICDFTCKVRLVNDSARQQRDAICKQRMKDNEVRNGKKLRIKERKNR